MEVCICCNKIDSFQDGLFIEIIEKGKKKYASFHHQLLLPSVYKPLE